MECVDRTVWSNVLTFVISVIGFVGNIFSIIVVSQPSMRAPVIVLIIGLAISDIFLLIVVNLIAGVPALMGSESACFEKYDTCYTFGKQINFSINDDVGKMFIITCFFFPAQSLSVNFVVAINVERYIAICHPFTIPRFESWRRQYVAALLVVIISFILSTASWFVNLILVNVYGPENNEQVAFVTGTVDVVMLCSFSCLVPFILLSWMTRRIFVEV